MKKIKIIIALLLCLALTAAFIACGGDSDSNDGTNK